MRLGLFALRAIEAGEELTFNYQFQNFSRESWKCLCGTDSCQGQLGGGVEERGEASDSASGQLQRERRRVSDSCCTPQPARSAWRSPRPLRPQRLPAPAKEVESSFARLWHAPYPYEGTFSHMGLRAWRVAHLRASSGRRAMRVPPEIWCTRWTCRAWRKAFGEREPDCTGGCAERGRAPSGRRGKKRAAASNCGGDAPTLMQTPDLSVLAAARIRRSCCRSLRRVGASVPVCLCGDGRQRSRCITAEVKHWVKEHCSESVAARSMIERLDMDTETAADEVRSPPLPAPAPHAVVCTGMCVSEDACH